MPKKISRHYEQVSDQIERKDRQLGKVFVKKGKEYIFGDEGSLSGNEDSGLEFTWQKRYFIESRGLYGSINGANVVSYVSEGGILQNRSIDNNDGFLLDELLPQYTNAVYSIEIKRSSLGRILNIPLQCIQSVRIEVNGIPVHDSGFAPNDKNRISITIPPNEWTKIVVYFYTGNSNTSLNFIRFRIPLREYVENHRNVLPSTPTNFDATKGSIQSGIKLTWGYLEPSYQTFLQILYRESGEEEYSVLESRIDSETQEFIHSSLAPGKVYYYKIRAITNDGDVSDFSDEVSGWASYDINDHNLEITLNDNQFIRNFPLIPVREEFKAAAYGKYGDEPIGFSIRSLMPLENPPTVLISGFEAGEDDPMVPLVWELALGSEESNYSWNYSFHPGGVPDGKSFHEGRLRIMASVNDELLTILSITYDKTPPVYSFSLDSDYTGQDPDGNKWTRDEEISIIPGDETQVYDNDENAYLDLDDNPEEMKLLEIKNDWNIESGEVGLNSTHYWDGDIDDEMGDAWTNFVSIFNDDTLANKIEVTYNLDLHTKLNEEGEFYVQVLLLEVDSIDPTKGIVRGSKEFVHTISFRHLVADLHGLGGGLTEPYNFMEYFLDTYSRKVSFGDLDPTKYYGIQIRLSQIHDIEVDPEFNVWFKEDTSSGVWYLTGVLEAPWDEDSYGVGLENERKFTGNIGDEINIVNTPGVLFKNNQSPILTGERMFCHSFLVGGLEEESSLEYLDVFVQTLVCTEVNINTWRVEKIEYTTVPFSLETEEPKEVLILIDDLDPDTIYHTQTRLYIYDTLENHIDNIVINWEDDITEFGTGSIQIHNRDYIPNYAEPRVEYFEFRKHTSGIMGVKVKETILREHPLEDEEFPPVYFPYLQGVAHEWKFHPVEDPEGGMREIEVEAFDGAGNFVETPTSKNIYFATGHISNVSNPQALSYLGKIVFKWDPIELGDAPELAGYKVWRRTDDSEPTSADLVDTLFGRDLVEHTDCLESRGGHLKPQTDYFYSVKGFTLFGEESENFVGDDGQTLFLPPARAVGVSLDKCENELEFIATFSPGEETGEHQDERRGVRYLIYRLDATDFVIGGWQPEPVEGDLEYLTVVSHTGDHTTEFSVIDTPPHRGRYYQYYCLAENNYGYRPTGGLTLKFGIVPGANNADRLSETPAAPTVVEVSGSHAMIRLIWAGANEADVNIYEIQRSTDSVIGNAETIATLPYNYEHQHGKNLVYDDLRGEGNLEPGQDYYYWIRAINNGDLASDWTGPEGPHELSVSPPNVPSLIEEESEGRYGYNHITISGNGCDHNLMAGYKIYRSLDSQSQNSDEIGFINDNRSASGHKIIYQDDTAQPFIPSYYWAKAVNRYGDESDFSNMIFLTMEPNYDEAFCNYLDNSSFERPLDASFNWNPTTPIYDDDSYHGGKCTEVGRRNQYSEKAIYSGYIFVQPEKEYDVSFYAKVNQGGWGQPRLCVFWYGPGRELIDSGVYTSFSGGGLLYDWARRHVTIESLPGATSASLEFSTNYTVAGRIHLIDAVQWEEKTENSPRPYVETRTLSADRMQAHIIQGDMIVANSISGHHIQAESISGDRIKAGTITLDRLETIPGDMHVSYMVNSEDYNFPELYDHGYNNLFIEMGGLLHKGLDTAGITINDIVAPDGDASVGNHGTDRIFQAPSNDAFYYGFYPKSSSIHHGGGDQIVITSSHTLALSDAEFFIWQFKNSIDPTEGGTGANAGYFVFLGRYGSPGVQIEGSQITAGLIDSEVMRTSLIEVRSPLNVKPVNGLQVVGAEDFVPSTIGQRRVMLIYPGDVLINGELYPLNGGEIGITGIGMEIDGPIPGTHTFYLDDPEGTSSFTDEWSWRIECPNRNNGHNIGDFYYAGLITSSYDGIDYSNQLVFTTGEDTAANVFTHVLWKWKKGSDEDLNPTFPYDIPATFIGSYDNSIGTTIDARGIATGFLDADRIKAESITSSKISANAITTEKIYAGAVRTEHIQAQAVVGAHFTATAVNLVNNTPVTDNLGDWGNRDAWGDIRDGLVSKLSINERRIRCFNDYLWGFRSKPFRINHSEIYKVSVTVSRSEANGETGIGVAAWSTGVPVYGLEGEGYLQGTLGISGYDSNREPETSGTIFEFLKFQTSQPVETVLVSYIVGAKADIDEMPQPTLIVDEVDRSEDVRFAKLAPETRSIALRFANLCGEIVSPMFVNSVSVTEMSSGKIVAENIFAKTLDADKLTISSEKSKVVINESGVTVGGSDVGKTVLSNTDLFYITPTNTISKYPKRIEIYKNLKCGSYFEFPEPFILPPKIALFPGLNNLSYRVDSPWDTRNQYVTNLATDITQEGFTPRQYLSSGVINFQFMVGYGGEYGAEGNFWVATQWTDGWYMKMQSVGEYTGPIDGTITDPMDNFIPFGNNFSPVWPTITGSVFKIDGTITNVPTVSKPSTAIIQALLCTSNDVVDPWVVKRIGYTPVPLSDVPEEHSSFNIEVDGLDPDVVYRVQLRLYAHPMHTNDLDEGLIGAVFGKNSSAPPFDGSPAQIGAWKFDTTGAIEADDSTFLNAIVKENF